MEIVPRASLGQGAASSRVNECELPWHRYTCCIAGSHLRENLFGELMCDRHEAADFHLSDLFCDEVAIPSRNSGPDQVNLDEAEEDHFRPCCIASRPPDENLFGDLVCVLHQDETFCLSDLFDDGTTGRSEEIDGLDEAVQPREDPETPDAPHASPGTVDQITERGAQYSRRVIAGTESVPMSRAASTIQKAWRNPAVRATVRASRARAYTLKQAEIQQRIWASRKIIAGWRMYQYRVAETAAAEADEAEAAVAMVEAMEAAAAAEAETAASGQASVVGELSCAYCSDPALYENLFGQLVCRLHEELTFSAQYPSAEGASGTGKSAQNVSDSRCPVCDERISDGGSGKYRTGGKCPFGHAICAACTAQYVKDTLLPRGTVFWDRIKCVKCAAYMGGMSVQRSIDDLELVKVVEARQFDAAYLICGERDPLSQEAVNKYTKPCPSCSAPTEKNGGCDHMTCYVCKHQYWYSCDCGYPVHTGACDARR